MKQTTVIAIVVMIVPLYLISFPLSLTEAQYQGQTLNGPENDNLTSSEKAVVDQTNVMSDNQTIPVINGISGARSNVTTAEIPNNVSQQQLQPLQQQEPSTLQQEQSPLQSPPPLQQPLPPPIMQPQQPFTSMPPTIPVSIVPNAATRGNQAFQPNPIYVNLWTGITWINYDTQTHTVTSGSAGSLDGGQIFDSGLLNLGATFVHNVVQYGIFSYHCTLHPQMVGTVVVS